MNETLIVTYSPKYAAYQRKIHEGQIERGQKILCPPGRKKKGKNPNDPMKFVKYTTITADGEIAEKTVYELDREQIEKEAMYDEFHADNSLKYCRWLYSFIYPYKPHRYSASKI